MTTWRAIASSECDSQSPVKQTLIEALEWNPRAVLEGDASAPNFLAAAVDANTIDGAAILNNTILTGYVAAATITKDKLISGTLATGAVAQSDVNTSSAIFTCTIKYNPGSGLFGQAYSLANGTYMLGWQSYSPSAAQPMAFKIGYRPWVRTPMVSGAYSGTDFVNWRTWVWAGMDPSNPGSPTGYVSLFYVVASPPYALPSKAQNGQPADVRRFVFVDLKPDGTPGCAAIMGDPPWYNDRNFPGIRYHDGGRVTWRRPVRPFDVTPENLADPSRRRAILSALDSDAGEDVELTAADKCTPELMDTHPHPFGSPEGTVIMLDPGAKATDDLIDLVEAGAEAQPLLEALRLDMPAPGGLHTPRGVALHRPTWRP